MLGRPGSLFTHALVISLLCTFAFAQPAAAQKPWERKGAKYKVKIDSSPQQAVVYIDSKVHGPLGYTPVETKLPKGTYKVALELPGYKPFEREITIGARNDPFLFVLERLPRPAVLDMRASPQDDSATGGRITIDNVPVGAVPAAVEVAAGRHQLTVTKEGFNAYSEWVDVAEGERRTIVIVLVKTAPALGTLIVTADVPKAEVWIDGQKRDDAPCVVQLPAGPHAVEVRSGTLQPFKQMVIVVAGQQLRLTAGLAGQIPQMGALRVHTPGVKGAEVYVDGELKGTTPGEIANLKPGPHVVEVRAPGYKPLEKEVTVKAGETAFVKVELEVIPEAKPMGTLVVKSTEPGVEVSIDGTSYGGAPLRREVAPGTYIVLVQKPGFPPFRREVVVQKDQVIEVVADMKAVGRLMVLAPPGAQVLLDGQVVGQTPMAATEVPVGEHVLEIRHASYQDYRQTITVEGGKPVNLEVDMKPRPTGPPPEQLQAMKRAASSFGAAALMPGGVTADIGLGFPYIFQGRLTVGALKVGPVGADGGIEFRTFGQANEILVHARLSFIDAAPISAGLNLAIGGGGSTDGRNSFDFQIGAAATMHFRDIATFTARGYFDIYSDRMCGGREGQSGAWNNADDLNSSRDVCRIYDQTQGVPQARPVPTATTEAFEKFVTKYIGATQVGQWDPRENRLAGTRFLLQAALELTFSTNGSFYIIVEGAPFQEERAAYMDLWNTVMLEHDPQFYARAGFTLKF